MTVSLFRAADKVRRTLIIRGDLRSRTGIAYDVRARARLLAGDFDIVGVDVHPDPADCAEHFPYPIINDDDVSQRIVASRHRPIALHHTPPDNFLGFPGAWNIGSFFWETDVAPLLRQWAVKIGLMDAMWAPCTMIADLIRSTGYMAPVHTITWPFDFAQLRRSDSRLRQGIVVRMFGRSGIQGFDVQNTSLAAAKAGAGCLFVTVQSMAARKGLPVLLGEWRTYLAETGNSNDLLILRLAFRHTSNLLASPEEHFAAMLRDAGFRAGQDVRIGIISSTLSDLQLTELFQASDAYVSTTFGEGFGGPTSRRTR